MQTKIIKDPLYDYIAVDQDICENIIDSKYFQRLRRIEQTSMRCLYPSARHDRFIHSLGVYHLAKMATAAIQSNGIIVIDERYDSEKEKFIPDDTSRKKLNFTFEMAALLHDVGHSPFSHTLENRFKTIYERDVNQKVVSKDILSIFLESIRNLIIERQEENYDIFAANVKTSKAASHEIVSCIVVLDCFKDVLDRLAKDRGLQIDYCFLCRCILGAQYSENNRINDYKNCIIKLLNSSIDVDKLDYIARDTQVSGFDNMLVDNVRLIKALALALYEDGENSCKLCLVFKKMATGVIQNVIISRNSLYTWIYSHHKVKYESHLIDKAIDLIFQKKYREDKNLYISKFFSVDRIEKELLCDDTVWTLFMDNIDIPEVSEIIERKSQKVAVWKSFAEFQAFFDTANDTMPLGDFSIDAMRNTLSSSDEEVKAFTEYLNKNRFEIQFDVVMNATKLSNIEHNSIIIFINNGLYSFDSLFGELYKPSKVPEFFYIYCKKDDKQRLNMNNSENKKELIAYIKQYDGFRKKPLT